MAEPELRLDAVGKRYGDVQALRDLSATLTPGVYGLLGPNGAGKSTLMRLVTTVAEPTTGRIEWNGENVHESPDAIRSVLGYLPQSFGVYPNLTAEEFLDYLAALRGVDAETASARIDELLSLVNLGDARDRRLGGFSGGMRRRVGIAQALLNDPDLLIVDEPTVGLDPAERVAFRNVITELAGDRIVVLSTHIVGDVEATASDLLLLDDGEFRYRGTPEGLVEQVGGRTWEWTVSADDLTAVKRDYLVSTTTRTPTGARVRAVAPERPTPDATAVDPRLEDAYLDAVESGRSAEAGASGGSAESGASAERDEATTAGD